MTGLPQTFHSQPVQPHFATLDAGGTTMTHIDWTEAAERYRAKAADLLRKANLAFEAGARKEAARLYDSAREYQEAAEDAEKKGLVS